MNGDDLPPSVRVWRTKDVIASVVFLCLWVLPIAYTGFNGGSPLPGIPRVLAHLTNASCLFTYAMPYTAFDYIQVLPTRDGDWETVPMEDYFRMAPFGYRTRLDEYLRMDAIDGPARGELIQFIHDRYAELHDGRGPAGARLVAGAVSATADVPVGRWRTPPLEDIPVERRRVWLTQMFDGVSEDGEPDR